jgi:elongation factor P--(R)-beta-lysine ligase
MNKPTVAMLKFRHEAKKAVRNFMDKQGFIELDTPYILDANTPDPYIDPLYVQKMSGEVLQLHTSPEIYLKQGLSLGLDKIYHLARVFRDDPPTDHHSIEFTMLEWYRTNADLFDLITDCSNLFLITHDIAKIAGLVRPDLELSIIHTDVDSLFWEYAKIDLPYLLDRISGGADDLLQTELVQKKGEHLPDNASFCDAFFHIMLKYVEPNLPKNNPTVISRWPVQLAALAAPCQDDRNYCDRFEIYWGGLEIANAYQECVDPDVLRSRFIKENCDRQKLNKPIFTIDENFLTSMAKTPKTAGIALGFDRLLLAVTNAQKISQVIFGFRAH